MFSWSKRLGIFLSGLSVLSLSVAADVTHSPHVHRIRVIAVAADVRAVVVLDEFGQLQRYVEGAAIAGSGWRVTHVSAQQATLEFSRRVHGSLLELRLHPGDDVDLGAEGIKATQLQHVDSVPMTKMRAAQHNSKVEH